LYVIDEMYDIWYRHISAGQKHRRYEVSTGRTLHIHITLK